MAREEQGSTHRWSLKMFTVIHSLFMGLIKTPSWLMLLRESAVIAIILPLNSPPTHTNTRGYFYPAHARIDVSLSAT